MEAIIIVVVTAGVFYWAFLAWRKNIGDQTSVLQSLALKNDWQYIAHPEPRPYTDLADHIGFTPGAVRISYLLSGIVFGKAFEMFLIIGPMKGGHYTAFGSLAYMTVIRTRESLQQIGSHDPRVNVFAYQGWNYITYGANAATNSDIQSLLDILKPAS